MDRRGFTLVELLFVVVLTALSIGVTVSLYGYSVSRLAQATSRFAALDQVRKLHDEIEFVVRDSVSASTYATVSGPALRCILASESKRAQTLSTTKDRKLSQSATPLSVTRRGYEKHGYGKRVWFYLADSSGTFNTVGTTLWRAERSDDSTPLPEDIVSSWKFHPGTSTPRFDLITGMSFVVSPTTRTVNATVSARALWREERQGMVGEKDSQTFSESRITCWRHWFR